MYHGDVVPGLPAAPAPRVRDRHLRAARASSTTPTRSARPRASAGATCSGSPRARASCTARCSRCSTATGRNPVELFQIWLNLPRRRQDGRALLHDAVGRRDPAARPLVDDAGPRDRGHRHRGRARRRRRPRRRPRIRGRRGPRPTSRSGTSQLEPGATCELPPAAGPTRCARSTCSRARRAISATARDRPRSADRRARCCGPGPTPRLVAGGRRRAECLVLQGRPIGEPVAQYGPFVMNDRGRDPAGVRRLPATGFGGWPWPADDPVHGPDGAASPATPTGGSKRPNPLGAARRGSAPRGGSVGTMKAAAYDARRPRGPALPGRRRSGGRRADVLVQVEAISIEGGDTLARGNDPAIGGPHVVGYQAAGTVIEVGSAVPDRRVGDRVVTVGLDGSHAELRSVPASVLLAGARRPRHRGRGLRAHPVRHRVRLPLRVRPPAGGRDRADPRRRQRGRHRRRAARRRGRRHRPRHRVADRQARTAGGARPRPRHQLRRAGLRRRGAPPDRRPRRRRDRRVGRRPGPPGQPPVPRLPRPVRLGRRRGTRAGPAARHLDHAAQQPDADRRTSWAPSCSSADGRTR